MGDTNGPAEPPMINRRQDSLPSREEKLLDFLIIGAGARGNAYAKALTDSSPDVRISAIAEPIAFKRQQFGRRYIWKDSKPKPHQAFESWRDFLTYEYDRRRRKQTGEAAADGVHGLFVCVLDELHAEIITAFAPLGLHIMSEKPLATILTDCLSIYRSLQPPGTRTPDVVFSIGHVLHYSPHNMLLRKLLLEDEIIGDVLSIEHTEPVGFWHFSHSYVRGNWRKESHTAPSLLTKSCHDIDLLLWLLCTPPASAPQTPPHLPSHITSSGSLLYFKPSRKPSLAGTATNCLSCAAEPSCIYSAKRIYQENHLSKGNAAWPINIIDPEIEDMYNSGNHKGAHDRLEQRLKEDYPTPTPDSNFPTDQTLIDSRPWYGRCVYESSNDVCDDQSVTITWEDSPHPHPHPQSPNSNKQPPLKGRGAKRAIFHMVAFTEKQCERRGRIYGTDGEISYDSKTIRVFDFATGKAQVHHPHQPGGGHGGGDAGLAMAFLKACRAVESGEMSVDEAQRVHIGCTLEDVIRSHAMVFAAEEARKEKQVVDWTQWWRTNVEEVIGH